ncbi:hypothetical protein KSS87_013363 [Heliosperma pusillum]|nr:hypothetical protein KSS87_013363 [Heliosperma pusillum]
MYRTKKFGPFMKCLLIILVPVEVALWTAIGLAVSAVMGFLYGHVCPFLDSFKSISIRGIPFGMKLLRALTDGTWNRVWSACTIVRDFADFSFHSYFSVMDELLLDNGDDRVELKVIMLPGCLISAIVGLVVDVVMITIITIYKSPILLIKGWQRLIQDLIGREGPFLESICVPFAGICILLWPLAVLTAVVLGILSSLGFGCYSAVVAYQENSTKRGFFYVIASISIYDEYTNDLLYLQEGSCFPRPKYRGQLETDREQLPVQELKQQPEIVGPLLTDSASTTLQAIVIWDSFFKAYEEIGVKLFQSRAIGLQDIESWKDSHNKIVSTGIPAYAFLECFLRSIKIGSPGFVLRNDVEITSVNRPEGRLLDWLYEPMSVMTAQIKHMDLTESEERYLYAHCLYAGDMEKIEGWRNGGIPPSDVIRRAQLEGISRRLQGLCLTLSRMPTSRRRFFEVVKKIEQEARTLHES